MNEPNDVIVFVLEGDQKGRVRRSRERGGSLTHRQITFVVFDRAVKSFTSGKFVSRLIRFASIEDKFEI